MWRGIRLFFDTGEIRVVRRIKSYWLDGLVLPIR